MQLNAGCGMHHPDGWTGLDIDPDVGAEIVAPATRIPLEDGSVTRILCSHLLEHLDYWDHMPKVLDEFRRVLEPGAELLVVGPDIERAILEGEPRKLLEQIIYWPPGYTMGWTKRQPPFAHAWTATAMFMEMALSDAGFEIECWSGKLSQLGDWPVPDRGNWQHAYRCRV